MIISELEKKINENRRRISKIDIILNEGNYNTIEEAQELRLEGQQLKDEIPLLEKEVEEAKVRQRDKALEAGKRRLKIIAKKSDEIQLEILKTQVILIRKVTDLRRLRNEANKLTNSFKELRSLMPPFHLVDSRNLNAFLRVEPYVPTELWKKVEPEWRKAWKEYHNV